MSNGSEAMPTPFARIRSFCGREGHLAHALDTGKVNEGGCPCETRYAASRPGRCVSAYLDASARGAKEDWPGCTRQGGASCGPSVRSRERLRGPPALRPCV
jgi:hypothetical protein